MFTNQFLIENDISFTSKHYRENRSIYTYVYGMEIYEQYLQYLKPLNIMSV